MSKGLKKVGLTPADDKILAKMTPEHSLVLRAADQEGASYASVAAVLGNVPTGTVKSRLSRARDQLNYLRAMSSVSP